MGPLDRDVIDRRLLRLERIVRRLERDADTTLEQYLADEDVQDRVERRLQLSAQICLDIANYLIARGDLEVPEEEENVFAVLVEGGALSPQLGRRLRSLVGFRNILVHDYLTVDDQIVHRNMREGLRDLRDFARAIVEFLKRSAGP